MSDVSNGELDLGSVHVTFPGWHIGRSCGNWYAFRGEAVALDGPRSLLRCYLHADTLLTLSSSSACRSTWTASESKSWPGLAAREFATALMLPHERRDRRRTSDGSVAAGAARGRA
jgi:hypothetical protein